MNAKEAIEALKLEGGIEITGNPVRIGTFFEALVEAEKDVCNCVDAIIERLLNELLQYREIGTVEECREAIEKQKPKKPRDIEYDYSYFICPTCGEGIYVSDNFESHKFCLNCGQAIRCPDENLEGMEDESSAI